MIGAIRLKWDSIVLTKLIGQAPATSYYHYRRMVHDHWYQHRLKWLKQLPSKWGRGRKGTKFLTVSSRKPRNRRTVAWFIPALKRARTTKSAIKAFDNFDAAIYTGSDALLNHETGGVTNSSRRMPVAVKTALKNPRDWLKKYPNRKTALTRKGDQYRLWEIKGKRKPKARLRYIWTRKVVNKPIANFYKTWDRGRKQRSQEAERTIEAIRNDLLQEVTR